jgi:hypothetical protein
MPKPVQEALVAQHADGRLADGEVEHADLGVGGLVAEGGGSPLADQFAGLEVVGREGRVGGVDRIERRVERDHQQPASRACWTAETMDEVSEGQQDALGAIGDAGLDRGDLGLMVAVDLAGIGLQFDAEFLGLGGQRLPSSSRRTDWCPSW